MSRRKEFLPAQIAIRLPERAKSEIEKRADHAEMSVSSWARMTLLKTLHTTPAIDEGEAVAA